MWFIFVGEIVYLILFIGPKEDDVIGLIELSSCANFLKLSIGVIVACGPFPLKFPIVDYEFSLCGS